MKQEKLKRLLYKFVNNAEQQGVYSLTQLIEEIKVTFKENGYADESSEKTI